MNTGQIIRSKSTNKFVSIPNSIAQGKDLSLGERGLMLYLLSLPNDWVVNKSNLHELVGEKKGTVDGIFKALQLKGFIVSAKVVDEKGHFKGWNHVVYDEPILPDSENFRNRFLPKSETTDIGKSCSIQNTNLKGLQSTKDITNTESENFEEKPEQTVPSFVEADRQKAREAMAEMAQIGTKNSEWADELKSNRVALETICRNTKIPMDIIIAGIGVFSDMETAKGVLHPNRNGFRSYYINWIMSPKWLELVKTNMQTKNISKPKYKNESVPQHVKDRIATQHNNRD